jgi:mono/diheme cytochrome c family protein
VKTHLISRARTYAGLLVPVVSILVAFALADTASKSKRPRAEASGELQVASIRRGRSLFVRSCAHCHGEDASGSGEDADGPDLHGLRISDARIHVVIRTGIPGEMPSFVRKHSAIDVADLTAYLRTLRSDAIKER